MLKVGITGQAGFIGTHLFNFLSLKTDEITTIHFEDGYFDNEKALQNFVKQCDTIVHLAALNRHSDPQVIYDTNVDLTVRLIKALELTGNKPHVLLSSSIQEEKDNLYGRSKQECRIMLENWASRNGAMFTGLIIPNVFGPFGKPFYNSVVATFCYQLNHNDQPKIQVDANLQLIYVIELAELIFKQIKSSPAPDSKITKYQVPYTSEIMVSDVLRILQGYKKMYIEEHTIPELKNRFELNLFNTFRSYIDLQTRYPVTLKKNSDQRGSFVETVRTGTGGQFSFSSTLPGITRGNHFHIRKIERFIVISGKAVIELRQIGTDKIFRFELDGDQPSFVDMPLWFTHNITNSGKEKLLTLFWINESFNPEDPDTFFEKV